MKYLFLNASLTNGGSERVMSILANQFAENGHDTTMLLLRDNKISNYEVSNKLKCYQLRYNTSNKILILIKRFFMVRKYIKEINPNVKFKSVLKTKMRDFGQKYIYPFADTIVLQTEQVKQFYSKKIQQKCVVIPNPIDSNLPKRFDKPRDKTIVAAGRCTEQKNFSMLLNAFAKFHEKQKDYKLIIYGTGPLLDDLKKQAEMLGITKFVLFPGYVSDVDEKIKKASVYVSSSNYEGISNSMLEALAMGVPSICTDCPVGGAALAIQDGVNGILIPVGDEKALYESLLRIVDDKKLSENMSMEACKIRDKYSPEKIYRMWEKL